MILIDINKSSSSSFSSFFCVAVNIYTNLIVFFYLDMPLSMSTCVESHPATYQSHTYMYLQKNQAKSKVSSLVFLICRLIDVFLILVFLEFSYFFFVLKKNYCSRNEK